MIVRINDMYKLLLSSIFDWRHFITGDRETLENYCIHCGVGDRVTFCYDGNIFTRAWNAFKFLLARGFYY